MIEITPTVSARLPAGHWNFQLFEDDPAAGGTFVMRQCTGAVVVQLPAVTDPETGVTTSPGIYENGETTHRGELVHWSSSPETGNAPKSHAEQWTERGGKHVVAPVGCRIRITEASQ